MTRLGKQLDRLVHGSILSAALGGRFTGSGALFAGSDPLSKYQSDASSILQAAKDGAAKAANDALQAGKTSLIDQARQKTVSAINANGGTVVPTDWLKMALVAGVAYAILKSEKS